MSGQTARKAWDTATDSQYSDLLTPAQALDTIDALKASGTVPVILFWGNGCEHCAAEMQMLQRLAQEHPSEFVMLGIETWHDDSNADARDAVEQELGLDTGTVPLLIIGGSVFQGYDEDDPNDDDIASAIEDAYGDQDRAQLGTQLLENALATANAQGSDADAAGE